MGSARRKPQMVVIGAVVVGLGLLAVLLGLAEDPPPPAGEPVVVCIDSTVSTDEIRDSYLPDLKEVVVEAAVSRSRFDAAACGANATGQVNWPVHVAFTGNYVDPEKVREQAEHQAVGVIEGTDDDPGIEDLVQVSSERNGTPLGEMLAVLGRQCRRAGGECSVYLFTDGEWADGMLKVRDGVSAPERQEYLATYSDRIDGLAGAEVNFIGVGYGTSIGELRLKEAELIAAELVRAAGAEMGAWSTRY